MSRKNMDDIFRDRLKNYDSDIDPNEIWAGIQDKKPNPRSDEDNKKPFPWWITGSVMFVTAALLLGLVLNNQQTAIQTANTRINAMSALTGTNEVNHNATKEAFVVQSESTNSIANPNPTTTNIEKDVIVDQNLKNNNTANTQNNTVVKTKSNNTTINTTVDVINSTILSTAKTNNAVENYIESNLNSSTINTTLTTISKSTINNTNNTNTNKSNFSNTTTRTSKVSIFEAVETKEAIPVIPMTVDIENYFENVELPDVSVPESEIAEGCYGGPAMTIAIGAHVSPDLVNHNISSTNEALFPYINERRRTEKLLESYHGGLDIYLRHRDGLFIRSGIEYGQINRRFKFNETWVEFDSTTNITTTFEREKKTTNIYRLIDVPLTIGYEFKVNNGDLSLYVEAGASMNLFFSTKGDIIDPNSPSDFYEPISITNSNTNSLDAYQDNVGISIIGGIGLRYEYMDGLFFYAQPAGKLYLNSFTKDDNIFDEKFSRFGINLGVIYRL